jgi:putative acetyltransferase
MPDAAFVLRPERAADHAAVAAIVRAAFGGDDEVAMVEGIRRSDRYEPDLALVAVRSGEPAGDVVGHAMLSWFDLVRDDDGSVERVLQLAPVAVRPDQQGAGVGSALCRELLRRADARGAPLVVVLGHPEYYPRFGFEPAARHGIRPPDPTMAPALFVAPLSGDRRGLRGQLAFPAYP